MSPSDRLRAQSQFAPLELRGVVRALADVLDGKEVSKEQWDVAVSRWCPVNYPLRPLAETLRAVGETIQAQRENHKSDKASSVGKGSLFESARQVAIAPLQD